MSGDVQSGQAMDYHRGMGPIGRDRASFHQENVPPQRAFSLMETVEGHLKLAYDIRNAMNEVLGRIRGHAPSPIRGDNRATDAPPARTLQALMEELSIVEAEIYEGTQELMRMT